MLYVIEQVHEADENEGRADEKGACGGAARSRFLVEPQKFKEEIDVACSKLSPDVVDRMVRTRIEQLEKQGLDFTAILDHRKEKYFERLSFAGSALQGHPDLSSIRSKDDLVAFYVDNILHNFSKKCDKVFDPFLGTGTTAIVSHYHEVNFIGCEIDKEYFEAAGIRIELQTAQEVLFK